MGRYVPSWGSLSSKLSLREGSEKTPGDAAEGPEKGSMNWRHLILFLVGLLYAVWHFAYRPLPALLENPILDLVAYHTPRFYLWMVWWYYLSPAVVVMLGGLILLAVWRVFFESRIPEPRLLLGIASGLAPEARRSRPRNRGRGTPSSGRHPANLQPLLAHHPGAGPVHRRGHIRGRRVREDLGLYASVRFSSCSAGKPTNPQLRAAALVLEVKGDFCHDIRQILARARVEEADYLELSMRRRMAVEPALGLVARFLLAGLHRFFAAQSAVRQGQGAVLAAGLYQSGPLDHRTSPGAPGERWVTLQQVYYCAIDPEFFAEKIRVRRSMERRPLIQGTLTIAARRPMGEPQMMTLAEWVWTRRRRRRTNIASRPTAFALRE